MIYAAKLKEQDEILKRLVKVFNIHVQSKDKQIISFSYNSSDLFQQVRDVTDKITTSFSVCDDKYEIIDSHGIESNVYALRMRLSDISRSQVQDFICCKVSIDDAEYQCIFLWR
jgi:hypothetical protein